MTEPHGHTHEWAVSACIFGIVCWSSGPLMVRGISAPVAAFTPMRLLLSVPVMSVAAIVGGGRLSKDLYKASVLPGILFFLSMTCGFASFQHTSIANATLISNMQPVLMLLIAPRLFGERATPSRIMLAVLAIGGVSIVVLGAGSGGEAGLSGDAFALANLAFWTAYFVLAKRQRDAGVHAGAFLAGIFTVAAAASIPWALVVRPDFGQVGGKDFLLVVGQVLVAGLMGHTAITWCARFLDVTFVSLVNLLSPALSMIGAWIIYNQSMKVVQVAGAVVMMLAVAAIVATRPKPLVPVDQGLTAE